MNKSTEKSGSKPGELLRRCTYAALLCGLRANGSPSTPSYAHW